MEYDEQRYKAWKLPHPVIVHWVLNPGLAFNEIVLGQRMPRVTLIDKTSPAPFAERTRVPCSACGALNDGRYWSRGNAMGHWFGLVCPECGARIRCLWNVTSLLVLAVTAPIWIWLRPVLEPRWLEWERKRLERVKARGFFVPDRSSWVMVGVGFGLALFAILALPGMLFRETSLVGMSVQLVIAAAAGAVFAVAMNRLMSTRGRGESS